MTHNVYIRGHKTRGDEVISKLVDIGGINKSHLNGSSIDSIYYIGEHNHICICGLNTPNGYKFEEIHLPPLVPENAVASTLPPQTAKEMREIAFNAKRKEFDELIVKIHEKASGGGLVHTTRRLSRTIREMLVEKGFIVSGDTENTFISW